MTDRIEGIEQNFDPYADDYGLKKEDIEWLIERANKCERLISKIYEINVILRIGKP